MLFKTILDSGDSNRGWIDHKIEAIINGEVVGYIVVSYIPSDRFALHYPEGPVDYAWKIAGSPSRSGPITKEWIASMYWSNHNESWGEANDRYESIKAMSEQDALTFYRNYIVPFCNKKYGKEFLRFKEHWVDYPTVGFISVECFRRGRGIGTALCVQAHKVMMSNFNLPLHSSTLQSDAAKRMWSKMLEQGIAVQAPLRKCDKHKGAKGIVQHKRYTIDDC